jgi:hypothetical protein
MTRRQQGRVPHQEPAPITPSTSPRIHTGEDAVAVALEVAAILESPVEGFPELRDVRRAASAARRIIEAELEPADEDRVLGALGKWASSTGLPEWTLEAILWELTDQVPDGTLHAGREQRARR